MTSSFPACARWFLDLLGHSSDRPEAGAAPLQEVLDVVADTLHLPPPLGLLALGVVDDHGVLTAIPEIHDIQELLQQRATPAETLLVDPTCAARLRIILPSRTPRVLGVTSFAEALSNGLKLIQPARDGELWAQDIDVGWTVERLFTVALERSSVPCGWSILAALAIGMLGKLPRLLSSSDEPGRSESLLSVHRWKLAFVRDVARRHAGECVRMDWPEPEVLDAFPTEVRWRILAHALQSAADSEASWTTVYATHAMEALKQGGPLLSPSKTSLRGAIGRALAATGSYELAAEELRQAIQDWQRMDPAAASYPLCELLRILGILEDRAAILALRDQVSPFLEPPSVSGAFVGLAWGRALEQGGEHQQALEVLTSAATFEQAPAHVKNSRLRWMVAAHRHLSNSEAARNTMAELEELGDSDQLHLARLHELLDAGCQEELDRPAQALLEAAEGGDEALNLLSMLAPGQDPRWAVREIDTLWRLCKEYRY